MRVFDERALRVLTTTKAWDVYRCFGAAVGWGRICRCIREDIFCPLKESCIARTAEILGFREKQEVDSNLEYLLEWHEKRMKSGMR